MKTEEKKPSTRWKHLKRDNWPLPQQFGTTTVLWPKWGVRGFACHQKRKYLHIRSHQTPSIPWSLVAMIVFGGQTTAGPYQMPTNLCCFLRTVLLVPSSAENLVTVDVDTEETIACGPASNPSRETVPDWFASLDEWVLQENPRENVCFGVMFGSVFRAFLLSHDSTPYCFSLFYLFGYVLFKFVFFVFLKTWEDMSM